jgi:hypothetical protein
MGSSLGFELFVTTGGIAEIRSCLNFVDVTWIFNNKRRKAA